MQSNVFDGSYPIEKERLVEEIDGPGSWPAHMSGKTGTDIEEFVTAWMVAMAMHGVAAKPADIRKALARRLDYRGLSDAVCRPHKSR